MAQDTGGLFLSLGLDFADLETGFIAAEKTVKQNLARLNSENNKIKLQMDTDLSKLEGVGSELDKIKVKYEAINRQLDLQRQKELLLSASLKDAQKKTGADSGVSRNAEMALLRQQKLVAQLEAELRKLNQARIAAQGDININVGDAKGKLNQLVTAFNELKSASGSASSVIAKAGEIMASLPNSLKVGVAIAALPLAFKAVEDSVLSIAKPAVEAGDAFYVMSRGMQMSIADAAKLSTIAKVTGIDINEVNSAMRRFSTQISKADGDNSLMIQTLRHYGAEVTDANGKLKNEIDLVGELSKALKNAEAEGNGEAFLNNVLGRFRSGDFVTFLEDYKDNVEQAKKVVKNGLADPARAHAIQGEWNTLNAQAGQLNAAFSSAFMPLAEKILPQATERMGELTKVIADNADGIKYLSEVAGDAFNTVEDVATVTAKGIINVVGGTLSFLADAKKTVGEVTGISETNSILRQGGAADNLDFGRNIGAIIGAVAGGRFGGMKGAIAGGALGGEILEGLATPLTKLALKFTGQWEEFQKKARLAREEAEQEQAKESSTVANIQTDLESKIANATSQRLKEKLQAIQETTQKSIEAGTLEATAWLKAEKDIAKAIKDARAEAEKANEELFQSIYNLEHNDLENKFNNVDRHRDEMIKRGADSGLANYEADLQRRKLNAEFERDVLSKVNQSYQTDLQNKLQAIEQEKQAFIQKGLEEVEATQWAENEKAKAIRDFNNDVVSQLDSIWRTETDNRIAQIEREKEAWIQKGVDEVKATEWAEKAKIDAQRNAAMQVLKQQQKEYKIYQEQGYGGLRAYKEAELLKAGIDPDYLYMTPAQLQDFQQSSKLAENSLLPNFMTPAERAENARRLSQWHDSVKQEAIQEKVGEIQYTNEKGEVVTEEFFHTLNSNVVLDSQQKGKGTEITSYNPEQYYQRSMRDMDYPVEEYQRSFGDYTNLTPDSTALESLAQQSANAAEQLANFGRVIESLDLTPDKRQEQYYSDAKQVQQPRNIEVNNTIQIDQATAWDSEHIQELAEKVADKITPAVEQAIGGDSNSY